MDGAKALALPCRYGQTLTVEKISKPEIHWKSFDCEGDLWFEQIFQILNGKIVKPKLSKASNQDTSSRLQQVLNELILFNSDLFQESGFSIETHLEFPQNWGLGSSSTLIVNLAKWAQINPYKLLSKTFGGSGYDVACAENNSPLCFQIVEDSHPKIEPVNFDPIFKTNLFFVHLNQKQNSREGIKHYRNQDLSRKKDWIVQVSNLTGNFLECRRLSTFEDLIDEHESLLSSILNLPTVKQSRFPDYPKALKSLGAWGGDFILATGGETEKDYFRNKGYSAILDYSEIIK